MADEEVSALRAEMLAAADEDEEANRFRQPATAKLRLLPRVVSTLQKTHLQQAIMDNNLLEGVKRWLEPLPDRSLPALNIQKELFGVLENMSIDTISLKKPSSAAADWYKRQEWTWPCGSILHIMQACRTFYSSGGRASR